MLSHTRVKLCEVDNSFMKIGNFEWFYKINWGRIKKPIFGLIISQQTMCLRAFLHPLNKESTAGKQAGLKFN